jgi:hypothetical protein
MARLASKNKRFAAGKVAHAHSNLAVKLAVQYFKRRHLPT